MNIPQVIIIIFVMASIVSFLAIGAYNSGVEKAKEANKEMELVKTSKTAQEALDHIEKARLAAHIG